MKLLTFILVTILSISMVFSKESRKVANDKSIVVRDTHSSLELFSINLSECDNNSKEIKFQPPWSQKLSFTYKCSIIESAIVLNLMKDKDLIISFVVGDSSKLDITLPLEKNLISISVE